MTVVVTTKVPWVAFPAYLFSNARFGISAQAQLDDADHCDTNLIGTGPFMLDDWRQNDHLTVVKNPDYWKPGLPYLDEIEYRPMPDATQMVNSIQSGEIDAMQTSSALAISDLREIADSGDVQLYETDEFTETGYLLVNTAKPPFDNILARRAIAYAIDLDTQNEVRNKGVLTKASGPFAPGNMGYLEDTGLPQFDLEKAKELVAQYEEETGLEFRFTLSHGAEPDAQEGAQFFIEMVEKAGVKVDSKVVDQSQGINDAIAGNFQATGWRNHPGGDPDTQYVWWHTGSPVNFGKFSDPEIDRLLDEGRSEPDPEKREQIYQDLNRRFAEQLYDLWSFWTLWANATDVNVHGLLGPDLPDGSGPLPGLANGHAVDGLWVEG
ncbi:MAG: ABC transporter substrate-binding protein [Acidimicrobiia bacterium]|nr:ABC transporter substrate-binding protein [Acidimicrobiia bacterium]